MIFAIYLGQPIDSRKSKIRRNSIPTIPTTTKTTTMTTTWTTTTTTWTTTDTVRRLLRLGECDYLLDYYSDNDWETGKPILVENGCIDEDYELKTDDEEDDNDESSRVLKYLTNQNRPYSVNDLVANLRYEIPKAMMQKVLDKLVQEDKVKEKVYGKQKTYFAKQHFDDYDDTKLKVLKYLTNQNRPYSVNDLVANLRNEIPKTMIQKVLDGLVQEGKVKEKVNGKQKVYAAVNQDEFTVASKANMEACDKKATKVQNELIESKAQIKVKEDKIRSSDSQLEKCLAENNYLHTG